MKVDKDQFTAIVGNLLKQVPTARKDEKLGRRKTGGPLIQPRTELDQAPTRRQKPGSDTSAGKPESSC
jgi:hypothetical protein